MTVYKVIDKDDCPYIFTEDIDDRCMIHIEDDNGDYAGAVSYIAEHAKYCLVTAVSCKSYLNDNLRDLIKSLMHDGYTVKATKPDGVIL